jgi:glycosyltransferase involved in cell wall biosynthesis
MKRVLIIEAQIKQYRVPFYERLHVALAADGVELKVAYSDPPLLEACKKDICDLPARYGMKVSGYWVAGGKLLFQPLLRAALESDLIIVDQANKFLLNHLLLPLALLGVKRLAFFGHGQNGRDKKLALSEWYRRRTLNWVSWWFAYTQRTTRYLVANGVPTAKITTVNNAIDTNEIREQVSATSDQKKDELRTHLGLPLDACLGLYCGALDTVKKIPFLIGAAKLIRDRVPNFHLLLVGGGPEQTSVEAAIETAPWIHLLGPRFGKDKSELIAVSDVMLMPGAVGLVILDAFAAGLPLLSTTLQSHGPEIEYLEEGINGLLCEPDVSAFAFMVSRLLSDREQLSRLRKGAVEAGAKYTMENMIENMRKGICECLGVPDKRLLQEALDVPREPVHL